MKAFKRFGLALSLAATLFFLSACTSNSKETDNSATNVGKGQHITLSYVAWDTEIASTNVIGAVLDNLGYDVTLTQLDNAIMWQAVATKGADAMVGAWLPGTHGEQYERYSSKLEDLGPNLDGAKIGLVVPSYMDVDSIEDLSDEANQVITGIEPGAGVVAATEQAAKDYDNLSDWTIQTSSSGAMTTTLGQTYKKEEPIVITGWSPHWMFQTYDLKYLDDPKNSFGDAESIHTMARQGLKDDMPEAYQVLDQFNWEVSDMEEVMFDISEGTDPEEAAKAWVDSHPEKVAEWTKGVIEE